METLTTFHQGDSYQWEFGYSEGHLWFWAMQKDDGFIRYAIVNAPISTYPYRDPIKNILHTLEHHSICRSPRPFKVGQGCDGSGDACVLWLLKDFCDYAHIDVQQLWEEAYKEHDVDRFSPLNLDFMEKSATWQGVERPDWGNDPQALQLLYRSLYSMNYRSLTQRLEEVSGIDWNWPNYS